MDAEKNGEKEPKRQNQSNNSQIPISIDKISECDAEKEKDDDVYTPMGIEDESTGLSRDV